MIKPANPCTPCRPFSILRPVTGSFYYHCDWHASHYVKVMLDQIFGRK